MITTQILTRFYTCIRNKKLLILVSYDVDAICTTKILIELLHSDNTLYTILPVQDKQCILKAYQENNHIEHFLLLNCGANLDIVAYLNPLPESKFYVIDNHRPIDIYNIYNSKQVIIIVDEDEEQNFPDYEDIFPPTEEEESDEESAPGEGDDQGPKIDITNRTVKKLQKRKMRLKAEEKRQKILFQYTEFSFYSIPTSLILYNVSWMLSKESNILLWCAIVGLTNNFLNKRLQTEKYILELSKLKNHVNRLNHKKENLNKEKVFIKLVSELNLSLYRHWTLFDSLYYSQHIACHFKIWSAQGRKRLNEFLADIGIPLSQCKQKFVCMEFEYRKNAKAWIEEFAEKYGIEDINYPSFTIAFGYSKLFGASDYALALNSLLETTDNKEKGDTGTRDDKGEESNVNFFATLDCLSHKTEFRTLYLGMELAKVQKKRIFEETLSLLEMHQILTVGPFLYASLPEHSAGTNCFSNSLSLQSLSHFLLYSYCAKNGSKKIKNLPIAITVPHQTQHSQPDHCTVIGIPPISIIESSSKNFLGKAFEQAATNTNVSIEVKNFDPTIVVIKNREKGKFFDALVSMLD